MIATTELDLSFGCFVLLPDVHCLLAPESRVSLNLLEWEVSKHQTQNPRRQLRKTRSILMLPILQHSLLFPCFSPFSHLHFQSRDYRAESFLLNPPSLQQAAPFQRPADSTVYACESNLPAWNYTIPISSHVRFFGPRPQMRKCNRRQKNPCTNCLFGKHPGCCCCRGQNDHWKLQEKPCFRVLGFNFAFHN